MPNLIRTLARRSGANEFADDWSRIQRAIEPLASDPLPSVRSVPSSAPAGPGRRLLIDELFRRYGQGGRQSRMLYRRKLLAWNCAVGGAALVKRAVDIVGAILGLLLLSPVFALIALCIRLTDGGPVLYIAPRVGKWGREFPFPKFRSMVIDAEHQKARLMKKNDHGGDGVTFKMKRDPRVTWIGRIIRKTSLDEAPQLWSVLLGHMSLVGPRPPVPSEVERYSLRDRRRLDVRPGLTCIWQVSGRSNLPFEKQVELDLRYIQSQSLWRDFWIILRTIPAVLLGRGAC